jgi:hypothetical protein
MLAAVVDDPVLFALVIVAFAALGVFLFSHWRRP